MAGKKLIALPSVVEKTGRSKSVIYSKISKGEFPPPIKDGSRSLWIESEIDDWIDSMIEKSRAA